jgi:hypothetical protein
MVASLDNVPVDCTSGVTSCVVNVRFFDIFNDKVLTLAESSGPIWEAMATSVAACC